MALGGVTCTFKRELKPYRKYEIWTRVLSWDEKWVYVISHIVKPDSANPTAYSDQPWKKNGTGDHSSFGKKTARVGEVCTTIVVCFNLFDSAPGNLRRFHRQVCL